MPKTYWVGNLSYSGKGKTKLAKLLGKIKTDWVVLKPYNGLKGIGVYVGPKDKALTFKFDKKLPEYIAQEFVDTSDGITGIAKGLHDLRIAIVGGKAVWSSVRVPPKGSFKANVAGGGELSEVDYDREVPLLVKKIVDEISSSFYQKFDDPSYSLDFGIGKDGRPKIFEINDQMGFPRWEMRQRDRFLKSLVSNFSRKLND